MVVQSTSEAIAHFRSVLSSDAVPRFVSVAGPTAVGKSTLSRRLLDTASELGSEVYVLEGDRFLVPQKLRPFPATFPGDVYEIDRLRAAIIAIAEGKVFRAPFYERDGRHTGRLMAAGEDTEEIIDICRSRSCSSTNELVITDSGEVVEVVDSAAGIWILDSELSLLYQDFRDLYDLSYGIRATRAVRKAHFMRAVLKGERYPFLSPEEAQAKIEGFWETDDSLIEPTVAFADVQIDFSEDNPETDPPVRRQLKTLYG